VNGILEKKTKNTKIQKQWFNRKEQQAARTWKMGYQINNYCGCTIEKFKILSQQQQKSPHKNKKTQMNN